MTIRISRDPIYRRRRFSAETIELCVRWYITYRLSYRDLAAMMAEREIDTGAIATGTAASARRLLWAPIRTYRWLARGRDTRQLERCSRRAWIRRSREVSCRVSVGYRGHSANCGPLRRASRHRPVDGFKILTVCSSPDEPAQSPTNAILGVTGTMGVSTN
jgi:hypothetical protein